MNAVVAGRAFCISPDAPVAIHAAPPLRRTRQPGEQRRLTVALEIDDERESTAPQAAHYFEGVRPDGFDPPLLEERPVESNRLVHLSETDEDWRVLFGSQETHPGPREVVAQPVHGRQSEQDVPNRFQPDQKNLFGVTHAPMVTLEFR